MKKKISIFLILTLCMGLFACGKDEKQELEELVKKEEYLGEDKGYLGEQKYRFKNVVFEVPEEFELDELSTALGDNICFNYGERRLVVKTTGDSFCKDDEAVKSSIEKWAEEAHYIDNEFEIIEAKATQIADRNAMIEEYRYILEDGYIWHREVIIYPELNRDGISFVTLSGKEETEDLWKEINSVVNSIVIL